MFFVRNHLLRAMESKRDIESVLAFVRQHQQEDVDRLLLSAKKYPEVDMAAVVDQLLARRQLKEKLPEWQANDHLYYPARIAAEQCSSERTATYKQGLVKAGDRLCDLTGGMGVDSYYLSRKVAQVTYVDPARRGEAGKRVFALSDCEPDLTVVLPALFQKAPRVLAKLSPMADLSFTYGLLPQTVAIHVLAVRGECKELLFCMERDRTVESPQIHCVHFTAGGEERFDFTMAEERMAEVQIGGALGTYLYEPNVAILKAGAFKSVAVRFGLSKLQVSSHLYTSDTWVEAFPGRRFQVKAVIPFHGKACKQLNRQLPQANLTTRNFPLSVNELRKRLKIAEGGMDYLFATTTADGEKVLIHGVKPEHQAD